MTNLEADRSVEDVENVEDVAVTADPKAEEDVVAVVVEDWPREEEELPIASSKKCAGYDLSFLDRCGDLENASPTDVALGRPTVGNSHTSPRPPPPPSPPPRPPPPPSPPPPLPSPPPRGALQRRFPLFGAHF